MQHARVSLLQIQLRLNDSIYHQSSVASIKEKESQSARETCRVILTCYYPAADLYSELKGMIRFTSMSRRLAAVPSAICTGITRFIHTKRKYMGCFFFFLFYIFAVLELCSSELGM
jgi:hypothetical protein